MSARGTSPTDLVNQGVIVDPPAADGSGPSGRTFIVTGLYRSGTSLVASILRHVGIFMGSRINDIVHEDEDLARAIETGDAAGLRRLIEERDAAYGTWGFKLPMLCDHFTPGDIAAFNQPHVIAVFRDPVAVSVREALSEHREQTAALRKAADDQAAMIAFVTGLRCPKLLLSYEKSLVLPAGFIDAITQFCGLPRSDRLRRRLVALIEPNKQSYLAGARRPKGIIEGVAGGCLFGWCRLPDSDDPVVLEFLVDDRPVLTFSADAFRQDLADAGFSDGRYGFSLDLPGLGVAADSILRVRIAGLAAELENSGRRTRDYPVVA